jgi:autotransporter-associated beta strand protein
MGGALFVQQGGSLILSGPLLVNGNSVAGGAGGYNGLNGVVAGGSAFGSGLFIQGTGSVTFSPGAGQTQVFSDVIADQTGSGGTSTAYGSSTGVGTLVMSGAGTLTLSGSNTYTGPTTITAGTLLVNGSLAAGSSVTVGPGATLGGSGTIGGSVTESAGGLVAQGGGIGTLTIGGSFTWNGSTDGSATLQAKLSTIDTTADRLAIAGALTKGTAGTFQFDFRGLGRSATTYTLATFASTNFDASDFSSANLGWGLTGTFAIVGGTQLQFTVNPAVLTIASGRSAAFSALAGGGSPTPACQWTLNGVPIPGATNPVLLVSNATQADAGTYACITGNGAGSATTLNVVSAAVPGYLTNLSGRGAVEADVVNGLFGGFAVSGPGVKQLLLRGIGPGLNTAFGLSGFLGDTQLKLYNQVPIVIGQDSGWGGTSALLAAESAVGAFAVPVNSLDSMLFQQLASGPYSCLVSGPGGATGLAMVEVYDADPSPPAARLTNVSVRAPVGSGANILIGGFVIGGSTAETVLIRAIGPSLMPLFGLVQPLASPVLSVFSSSQQLVATNTVWGGNPALAAVFGVVGAYTISPGSQDSVVLVTLPPGAYTAEVTGLGNTSGIATLEVYEVY